MKTSYIPNGNNSLSDKSEIELLDMLNNPNLNEVSKIEINLALLDKLDEVKKK